MKLARLANPLFHQALNKLVAQPLPLRAAFKLKGITSRVNEEFRKYEELRHTALEKYGTKGEDGKLVLVDNNAQFTPENLDLFAKDLNDLGGTDVEVGFIKLDELGDKAELSADDCMVLDGLVVES